MLACLLVGVIFPQDGMSVASVWDSLEPSINSSSNYGRAFVAEFMLTYILIFVIFAVVFDEIEEEKKQSMTLKGFANSRGLTLYTSTPQSKSGFAPIAIGCLIGVLTNMGATSSGGAFNPAGICFACFCALCFVAAVFRVCVSRIFPFRVHPRGPHLSFLRLRLGVFGPALFSAKWKDIWVYWIGDLLGAAAAAFTRYISISLPKLILLYSLLFTPHDPISIMRAFVSPIATTSSVLHPSEHSRDNHSNNTNQPTNEQTNSGGLTAWALKNQRAQNRQRTTGGARMSVANNRASLVAAAHAAAAEAEEANAALSGGARREGSDGSGTMEGYVRSDAQV